MGLHFSQILNQLCAQERSTKLCPTQTDKAKNPSFLSLRNKERKEFLFVHILRTKTRSNSGVLSCKNIGPENTNKSILYGGQKRVFASHKKTQKKTSTNQLEKHLCSSLTASDVVDTYITRKKNILLRWLLQYLEWILLRGNLEGNAVSMMSSNEKSFYTCLLDEGNPLILCPIWERKTRKTDDVSERTLANIRTMAAVENSTYLVYLIWP